MIRVSRERNDPPATDFWQYILQILQHLQHDGMSDEEDANQLVTRGEFSGIEPIKQVLVLRFRNPYFRKLFEMIDQTKAFEKLVFTQTGRQALKRVRVGTASTREPPKGLPRNFLDENYLAGLLPYQVDALWCTKDSTLRQIEGLAGNLD